MLLSQSKLLNIFGLTNRFNWSRIHALFFFLRGERFEVFKEYLIFEEGEQALEKTTDSKFNIIVKVAFHPLLHEIEVFFFREHNFVI